MPEICGSAALDGRGVYWHAPAEAAFAAFAVLPLPALGGERVGVGVYTDVVSLPHRAISNGNQGPNDVFSPG